MKKTLYIIGDSFCRSHYVKPLHDQEECFWVSDLEKKISDYNIFCDGEPSRDVQTIIDTWIRLLKYVENDDIIIVCLPFFRRTRLPLNEKDYIKKYFKEFAIYTRFVGTPSYHNQHVSLEFWDQKYDSKYFLDKLSNQEIINTSKANQLNTIEIVESLIKISKIKTYIFTWDVMDFKTEFIEDKNDITKKIGFWETHYDVHQQTDGKFGAHGDFHWSHKMNKGFSDYVYKKLFQQ